jgi:leucyl/phenylalanyl-tRNA--protein transferase
VIPWLTFHDPFPPVEMAMTEPNGLLAAGGDLSVERLLEAYAHGIFPWAGEDDPLLWWSPDPRMVLVTGELHVSRSLRRLVRSGRFEVTLDRAFREVMAGCAEPRAQETGTWITAEMMAAYERMAERGYAHSVEVWLDGELVGGLYGVALGRMFYGESMFSRRSNASKVAMAYLARQLERWGFELIDCQMPTAHLVTMGAREIPRAEFLRRLHVLIRQTPVASPWSLQAGLAETL